MVLSVNKTRCGDEESEKGDEILSTDRLAAVHCSGTVAAIKEGV